MNLKSRNRLIKIISSCFLNFKCISFIFSIIFFSQNIHSQKLLWQKLFDARDQDAAKGVAADRNGNIIVTGLSFDFTTGEGGCLTIKYNQDGDTVWTRLIPAVGYNAFAVKDIFTDSIGNIFLLGYIRDNDTTYNQAVKYNPDGNILWTRRSVNEHIENYYCHYAIDSRENIIFLGTLDSGNYGDYITMKYDSSGILLWERINDGGWEDVAQDIVVDDSDNVIVTGYSDSGINWDWCTIKYNSDGDTTWIRKYHIGYDDWAQGITCDKKGNIIVVGNLGHAPGSFAGIVKYSSAGDTLWSNLIDYRRNYISVVTDENLNIYVLGGYSSCFVVKCSPGGDTLWTNYYAENIREPDEIALDNSGNIIFTATTIKEQDWLNDYLTIKVSNIITNLVNDINLPSDFYLYQNYPNPFNPTTTIRFSIKTQSDVKISITNILGQNIGDLINKEMNPGIYEILWNAYNYSSGVYFCILYINNQMVSTKELLLVK